MQRSSVEKLRLVTGSSVPSPKSDVCVPSNHSTEPFTRERLTQAISVVAATQQLFNEEQPPLTPAGEIRDASMLFSVVRELRLDYITLADVNDIFEQIVKGKEGFPFVSSSSIGVGELLEWIDTISALNGAHSPPGHRSPQRRISPTAALGADNFFLVVEDANGAVNRASSHESSRAAEESPSVTHPNTSASSHSFEQALARAIVTPEVQAAMGAKDSDAVFASLMSRGFGDALSKIMLEAVSQPEATVQTVLKASNNSANGKNRITSHRRTLAFSSALALRHVGSGTGASMGIVATLLFVDISGYSAVTSAMEGMGAHALSTVVNTYLEKIVRVLCDHGGDIVKFAGDALLAIWCTGGEAQNCVAATRAAWTLLRAHGTEPVNHTNLTFGIHCGISHGRCTSRIFSPRKLRANDMPTHFHFLSGSPLNEVGEACALASRGELVIHKSVLDNIMAHAPDFQQAPVPSEPDLYFLIRSADVQQWAKAPIPGKLTPPAASGGGSSNAGEFERYFIPPKVCRVLDSGMDQFFMAEMRELVVLFLHFAETTDVEVWFDEVFHVLESFACDVVQIIDDDKGVHIVAALNLYLMAERSVDASIGIGLALRAKHCDAHVGVASGTVFCGVLGSGEACQWDISGAACVRAARLMQYAVANDLTVCFDESIFASARDRSHLKELPPIDVKGSPDPVHIYTLRDATLSQRASTFQIAEKIPTLSFHQSLCPLVHHKTIRDIRKDLRLPTAIQVAMEMSEKARRRSATQKGELSGEDDDHGDDSSSNHTTHPIGSASSLCATPNSSRIDAAPVNTKMIVLTGTSGTGKFSTAVNALSESNTVPIVHECFERHTLTQLVVVHTLATWFSFSKNSSIRNAAEEVLRTYRDHRYNEAFSQAIVLLQTVCSVADRRFALIVKSAQFLDQSSVSFLGIAAKKLENCAHFFLLITCSPLYGYPEPQKKFVAFGNVKVYELASISDAEVRHLFTHCVQHKADDRLESFVRRKTNNNVECVVELARYLQRRALLNLGSDGMARIRPTNMDEIDRMMWGDISPTVRLKAIHVLDHLTPELLTMCKIIASITEQPLISAFFYSVSKVCEVLQKSELNVDDVRTLDSLWLLKMCEHRCTAHSGGGDLDAAVFLVPAMRDVAQSLLVPQQRVAINKICGDCYAETHPMDHPMQYLVRARHYLFAGMRNEYVQDLRKGWQQLLADGATAHIKDHALIKGRYFEWMCDVEPGPELDTVLHNDPVLLKEFTAFHRKRRQAGGSMLATSRIGASRVSNIHGADLAILRLVNTLSDSNYYPLELGAAQPALVELLHALQLLLEVADASLVGASSMGASLPAPSSSITSSADDLSIEALLDQVSTAMTTYILSVTFCINGVSIGPSLSSHDVQGALQPLKAFVEKLDSENFRESLFPKPEQEGEASDAYLNQQCNSGNNIKSLVLTILELMEAHVKDAIEPLCEVLRGETDSILEATWKLSATVRRQMRFTGVCALGEACRALRDHPMSVERGDVLVSLFENLPTILEVYCPGSEKLQRIFCSGMEAYYLGTLQPPDTHSKLRRTLAVFWFSWLNCCSQQLLFH